MKYKFVRAKKCFGFQWVSKFPDTNVFINKVIMLGWIKPKDTHLGYFEYGVANCLKSYEKDVLWAKDFYFWFFHVIYGIGMPK